MTQTARGASSWAANSVQRCRAAGALRRSRATAAGSTSYTTHSWPSSSGRVTRLAPMRPRPIMPSCMLSFRRSHRWVCYARRSPVPRINGWSNCRGERRVRRSARARSAGQRLAQLDTPLVEAVDVPDHPWVNTLCSYSAISWPSTCGVNLFGEDRGGGMVARRSVRYGLDPPAPPRAVRPSALRSGRRSWPSADRDASPMGKFDSGESDEVGGDQLRALVDELVVGVLSVGARGAPHDGTGFGRAPARRGGRPTCRWIPCRVVAGRRGSGRAPGCRAARRGSRRRRSCRTRRRPAP